MTPDEREGWLLDYATLLANMRPDPVLRECSPLPWDTTEFPDEVEL